VILHFLALRNKRRDEELDEEDGNEQEACSSSEDIAVNTTLVAGKSNTRWPYSQTVCDSFPDWMNLVLGLYEPHSQTLREFFTAWE